MNNIIAIGKKLIEGDFEKYNRIILNRIDNIYRIIGTSIDFNIDRKMGVVEPIGDFLRFNSEYFWKMRDEDKLITAELFMSFYVNYIYSTPEIKYKVKTFEYLKKILNSDISIKMPFFITTIEEYEEYAFDEYTLFDTNVLSFILKIIITFDDMFDEIIKFINTSLWSRRFVGKFNKYINTYPKELCFYDNFEDYKEFIQFFIRIFSDSKKSKRCINIFEKYSNMLFHIQNLDKTYSPLAKIRYEYMLDGYKLLTIILKCIDENTLDKDIKHKFEFYLCEFINVCNREHIDHYEDLLEQLLKGNTKILTLMRC